MTAIDNARHRRFLADIEQRLLLLDEDRRHSVQPGAEQLHHLFDQYREQLLMLRALIDKYGTAQRALRKQMRALQIKQKNEDAKRDKEYFKNHQDNSGNNAHAVVQVSGNAVRRIKVA